MVNETAAGEFTGVMSIRAHVLERLRSIASQLATGGDGDGLFFEAVLQQLIDRGEAALLNVVRVTGLPWREIDTPEDLMAARELFRTGVP